MVATSTAPVVEVAVVDPDHVGVGLQRPLQLTLVVDLDQAVEVEAARLLVERAQLGVVERADDQQHRVGAVDRRLVELVGVDDEVLAQDRQVAGGPGGAQVLERAAEVGLVGEHRERRGAAALVGADLVRDGRASADISPALGERRLNSAISERPGRTSASLKGRSSPRPCSCDSRSACGTWRRRSSTPSRAAEMSCSIIPTGPRKPSRRRRRLPRSSRSSKISASPESIASAALPTPASRLSATPPT